MGGGIEGFGLETNRKVEIPTKRFGVNFPGREQNTAVVPCYCNEWCRHGCGVAEITSYFGVNCAVPPESFIHVRSEVRGLG